jgi:hypothetical protein
VKYKLKLPATSRIHDVFHVSLLKPVKCTGLVPYTPLPLDTLPVQVPEMVLQRRVVYKHNRVYNELLIKWEGLDSTMATWEDENMMLKQFPEFMTWGQAVVDGGRNVTMLPVDGEIPST